MDFLRRIALARLAADRRESDGGPDRPARPRQVGSRTVFPMPFCSGWGARALCPEVLGECFGRREGFPELRILDSTDPAEIRECERSVSIESTLFISASKSGSTIETALLTDYFLDRLSARIGPGRAAGQFLAITDPGSRLEAKARDAGFGHLLHGVPEIGGRYSALSHFGMAPAAAMGLDTERLLAGAQAMRSACGPEVPFEHNPGLRLGLLLGAAAQAGRDKLTLIASPGVQSLGTWIEQLVAESTGKLGRGIVPVEGRGSARRDHIRPRPRLRDSLASWR